MGSSDLAQHLRDAVVAAIRAFRRERPSEHPYGFALVGGQAGDYVGFAIATEEGLRETAKRYARLGYRCDGPASEAAEDIERLSVWLRWANPDDGWRYGDFDDSEALCRSLRLLFAPTHKGGSLEAFCTDEVLRPLGRDADWGHDPLSRSLIVGFTYGADPRDFLRSATRANPYPRVIELWSQFRQAEEVERRVKRHPPGR
jgi:hypothetical protein